MQFKCKVRLCGDGCRYCQPQEYIERLHEILGEERTEYEQMEKHRAELMAKVAALQARIDELMLEFFGPSFLNG